MSVYSKRMIVAVVGFLLMLEVMDSTILNTSLPQIAKSLHDNPIDLKVAITSYLLSLGVFIPASGWLADRFGVRRILKLAITLFMAGSIGCGLSWNLPVLVVFRVLQGIGGAFMMPVGRLVLLRTLGNVEMITALARVSTLGLIGGALGPVIGGALTTYVSWRVIFFVNIPMGLVVIYAIGRYFPSLRQPLDQPFDWLGFIVLGSGLALLLFMLDMMIEPQFSWSLKLGLFVVALSAIGAYFWHAKRCEYPMLDMRVFRDKIFTLAVLISVFIRLGIGAIPFLVPLMLQAGYRLSAMQAGMMMISMAFGMMCAKAGVKPLFRRFPLKPMLFLNGLLLTLIIALMSQLTQGFFPMAIVALVFVYGLVSSFMFSMVNSLAYLNLAAEDHSKGSSIYSTLVQVSSSFGVAFGALFLMLSLGSAHLGHSIDLEAFYHAFVAIAIFPAMALLLVLKLPKEKPVV